MSEVIVRALTEDQWSEYRSIRLAALKEAPGAYTSSYDEEIDHDERRWRACMLRACRLLAERDGRPIGVASVGPSRDEHLTADLFGLWVEPLARNTGVAWRLVEAAEREALKNGSNQLDYWVGTQNGRAIGFATNCGFRVTSRRRSARVPSEEFGDQEIALAYPLSGDPGVPNPMGPELSAPAGPVDRDHSTDGGDDLIGPDGLDR